MIEANASVLQSLIVSVLDRYTASFASAVSRLMAMIRSIIPSRNSNSRPPSFFCLTLLASFMIAGLARAQVPVADEGADAVDFAAQAEDGAGGPAGLRDQLPNKMARPSGLAVTVLGSGGPIAMSARASSGYVVFIDRVPRIMIDGGGGTFQRLGQGRIFDLVRLDTWLFSHFHIDHSSDFPAIIKSMYFLRRGYNVTPLTVVGPEAWGDFPSATEFVSAFFDKDKGIYRYLHAFLHTVYGKDLNFRTIDVPYDYEKVKTPQMVFEKDGLRVTTIPVMHGPREAKTPAVAYRIDYHGQSITYSGDLNSQTGNLATLARGTDVLIYDASLGRAMQMSPADVYHSKPSDIGKIAQQAGVKKLVLSHLMPPYVDMKIKGIVADVKQYYSGPVVVAEDLMTITPDGDASANTEESHRKPGEGLRERFRKRRQNQN